MAQLRNLGMPFGSPGGIINIPAPAGSALAGQIRMRSMEGLGQALGLGWGRKEQQELWQQDKLNWQLAQQSQLPQGMVGPQMGMPQMQSQIGQQAQMQSQLGNMFGDPYGKSPWWVQGATKEQIEDYRGRVGGPLVQIGERLLPPEDRLRGARADLEKKLAQKRLTPTDLKSVRDTIKEIMGEAKALPFGAKPGYALKQGDMNLRWESAMESTGYDALDKVAQKQIENEFDRYVAMLNKGKGAGVLKGQYQWDRRKYKTQERTLEPLKENITPITATNPNTGERIQSFDGGKTWQPLP